MSADDITRIIEKWHDSVKRFQIYITRRPDENHAQHHAVFSRWTAV
jgi:hypothetical protein